MKKLLRASSTNALSLISLGLNFLLLIKINARYGVSEQTDIYFFSLMISVFLAIVSQLLWEAMSKYMIQYQSRYSIKASYLYSSLLNLNMLLSLTIIIIYFILALSQLFPSSIRHFMDIFIFYTLLQNIYIFNKYVLNLQERYHLFYLLDIIIVGINLITIYTIPFYNDILLLAYSTILSTFCIIIYQFYLIFNKYKLHYYPILYASSFGEVYLNSFNLKLGQVFYLSKDLLLSLYIQNLSIPGLYTLYTYAVKFTGLVFQTIQIPIFNKFVVDLSRHLSQQAYRKANRLLYNKIIQTIILIGISLSLIYLLLPYILPILFNGITLPQIDITRTIYLYISFATLLYIPIVFQERFLSFTGYYHHILKVGIVFFLITLLAFLLTKTAVIASFLSQLVILPVALYATMMTLLYLISTTSRSNP